MDNNLFIINNVLHVSGVVIINQFHLVRHTFDIHIKLRTVP
jgi:hypothetical protein